MKPFQPSWAQPKRKKKPPSLGWEGFTNRGITPEASQAVAAPVNAAVAEQQAGPPVDPMLEAQKAAAARNIELGNAFDTYRTGQIDTSFGDLDAASNPYADLSANPYSQAAQLQRSFQNSQRGSLNGYAAQGQLYAGSLQNAQEANLKGYNQGLNTLKEQKQGQLDQILQEKLSRYSQTGAEIDDKTLSSLLALLGVTK